MEAGVWGELEREDGGRAGHGCVSSGLNSRNGKVYSVVAAVKRTIELFAMSQRVCIPAFIVISTLIGVSRSCTTIAGPVNLDLLIAHHRTHLHPSNPSNELITPTHHYCPLSPPALPPPPLISHHVPSHHLIHHHPHHPTTITTHHHPSTQPRHKHQ